MTMMASMQTKRQIVAMPPAGYDEYDSNVCFDGARGGGQSMHLETRVLISGGAGFLGSHLGE
jgi:hypothetical protein